MSRSALGSTVMVFSALLLAIVPFAIMAWYVTTRAGGNFQDDYGLYIPHLARMWNEGISYDNILNGSPHGPHFTAIPLLFRAVAMKLGYWDAFLETYVSLALGIGRVILIYGIFATVLPTYKQRLVMLMVAASLIFAPVQLGLYAYGDTGMTMGPDTFGFLLGLWGAIAFPRSWRGVTLIILGGFISSWSWGMGGAWCIFFITMLLNRFKWKQFLAVVAGFVLTHAPMLKFVDDLSSSGNYDFFNYKMIIGALGRPFVPNVNNIGDYPYANYIGTVGLSISVLFAIFILYQAHKTHRVPSWAIPSCAMILYSLIYIYQVSLVRTGIGAWYVALTLYFWLGIAGLAIAQIRFPLFGSPSRVMSAMFGIAVLVLMGVLYVPANRSFENKTPFLHARSLSSESCLRHYQTAPTFCEMLVFFWPPTYEFTSFGRFFQETQLSIYGSHQTWTLQGDYVLKAVSLDEDPERPQIQWIRKHDYMPGMPANWQTHNRLSLYLPSGQKVNWTINLPSPLKNAIFRSEISNNGEDSITVSITARGTERSDQIILRQTVQPGANVPVQLDLSAFAGQSITLLFSTETLGKSMGAELYYPRIEIDRRRTPAVKATQTYYDIQGVPENTELAPQDHASYTDQDIMLDGRKEVIWHELYSNALTPSGGAVCAGDYKALKITLNMPEHISIRMLKILVSTRKSNGNYYENEIQLPLLKDGNTHTYTIETKLINFDKKNKLEMVRMYSLSGAGTIAEQQTIVKIPAVQLIHNGLDKSFCNW